MLSPLSNRFGIPGVISVIALVFAMLGGAYAASNSGGDGASASAKKSRKGPPGPRGKTGPAGPAGPAGPQGLAGANGKDGANGTNGKDGADGDDGAPGDDGKSVTVEEVEVGDFFACDGNGGAEVEVEGSGEPVEVCSGKEGKDGIEGKPWTPNSTLPVGATLTGFYVAAGTTAGQMAFSQISFPIKLAGELGEEKVHYLAPGAKTPECQGTFKGPEALSGHLCVYESNLQSFTTEFKGIMREEEGEGALKTGALLQFEMEAAGYVSGTWAVTGF